MNITDYVIIIILLTANLAHLISGNLKFQPIVFESAHQHEYYFYASLTGLLVRRTPSK